MGTFLAAAIRVNSLDGTAAAEDNSGWSRLRPRHLSESPELNQVTTLPVGTGGRTGLGGSVSLVTETTMLTTSTGKTTRFTMLVDGPADPVDTRITTDGLVHWVNEDNLEVLVQGIRVDPVAVKHTETTTVTTNTAFGDVSQVLGVLQLVYTSSLGLTVADTLGDRPFTATTTNTDTPDYVSLLGLVSHSACLIGTRWSGKTNHTVHLAILPGTNSLLESHNITLLLVPYVLHVRVHPHCKSSPTKLEKLCGDS